MRIAPRYPSDMIIRKLESIFALTDEEKQALHDLPIQTKEIGTNQHIVRVGEHPTKCFLIIEGFACLHKLSAEGKRQIITIHVPGDIPDLQSLHLQVLDINISSMTPCKLGFIKHSDLHKLCEDYPRLAGALWRETLVHASIFREWLLNNGQRNAYSRIAHLICELMQRLEAVGLTDEQTFDMPITQAELADATGLTPVHVNRVMQSLRSDGLINTHKQQVTLPDREKIREAGEFDPLYLHIKQEVTA